MLPLAVLISTFLLVVISMKIATNSIHWKRAGRLSMSAMLVFTAMGHFIYTNGMTAMIPQVLCCPTEMVILSGVLEIVLALGLIFWKKKTFIGWVIIGFFVLVLPLNIYAAIEHIDYRTGTQDGPGLQYLWFRIPLQMLFILWVYFSTKTS